MQKKSAFLICAIAALMTFGQAFAQSSHDAVGGRDADYANNPSKYEIGTGNYKLGFGGHLQQMTGLSYNLDTKKANFGFSIPRARLKLYGNAFDPSITYLFQAQFEGDLKRQSIAGEQYAAPGTERLRDYYVNLAVDQDYFHVRLGKFRTPFSRQQLMSTSQMQFADQHSANNQFELTHGGRDIGLMFHNGFNQTFEWALAVVSNGVVARLGYNHGGIDGYEMADFNGGDFRFAIAANGFMHTDYKSFNTNDLRAGIDFVAKVAGFAANGAFYWQKKNDNMKNVGAGVDMGYLINKRFEPVVRVSAVSSDLKKFNIEAKAGVNYYAYGHHLKFQLAGGTEFRDNTKMGDINVGLQVQFAL